MRKPRRKRLDNAFFQKKYARQLKKRKLAKELGDDQGVNRQLGADGGEEYITK